MSRIRKTFDVTSVHLKVAFHASGGSYRSQRLRIALHAEGPPMGRSCIWQYLFLSQRKTGIARCNH